MIHRSIGHLKVLAPLAFVAGLGLLVGCNGGGSSSGTAASTSSSGSTSTGGKKLTVGFAQIGAESAWRTAETKSVKDEAEKRGIDLKFVDAQQKQTNEVQAIHGFIAQKVDAILLAPVVVDGWEPVLKEAKAAKIPVILLDRSVNVSDDSLYNTMIGPDSIAEGKRAGEEMVKLLGGKGNVVELQGTVGSAPAIDRKKGFESAIAGTGIKIIESQTGDFKRSNGKEVMEAFLKAHPHDIQAVFAHNDDMAMGAMQAIQEAGLKPGVDIKIVSVDGIHDALDAIAKGTSNVSVECNPLLGPKAFDAVSDLLAGKSLAKKIVVPDQTFDSSNAAKLLPDRKY